MEISFDKWLASSKEGFNKTQQRPCCDTRKGRNKPCAVQQSLRATALTNGLIKCVPQCCHAPLFALLTASPHGAQWWKVLTLTDVTVEGVRKKWGAETADAWGTSKQTQSTQPRRSGNRIRRENCVFAVFLQAVGLVGWGNALYSKWKNCHLLMLAQFLIFFF